MSLFSMRRNWLWVLVDEVEEGSQWRQKALVFSCYFSQIFERIINCQPKAVITWTSSRLSKGSLRGGTRIGCVSPIECSTLVKCPKSLDPLETTLLSRASMSYTRSFSLSEIDGLCHFSHNLLQILGLRGHTMCSCTFWLDVVLDYSVRCTCRCILLVFIQKWA